MIAERALYTDVTWVSEDFQHVSFQCSLLQNLKRSSGTKFKPKTELVLLRCTNSLIKTVPKIVAQHQLSFALGRC